VRFVVEGSKETELEATPASGSSAGVRAGERARSMINRRWVLVEGTYLRLISSSARGSGPDARG